MEIRLLPIAKINPAPYNPRRDLKPGDIEYEKLKKSIEAFDLVEPLIWNETTGNLVGGHQRLKILKARGDTAVACVVVKLSQVEEKALNIALNRIEGEWLMPELKDLLQELDDGMRDMEALGFTSEELEALMTQFHVPPEEEPKEREPKTITCPACGNQWEE